MSDKNWLQGLTKSRKEKWIGGVCGGLGAHSPAPSWCWRLIFVLLFMLYGTGLIQRAQRRYEGQRNQTENI